MNDRTLHLAVSGLLWRRSPVTVDKETKTYWSHLLGKAMRGPLKESRLESIPSTMTTWQSWRRKHPATTAINLPRTSGRYVGQFYQRPHQFVYGWVHEGEQAFAVSLEDLLKRDLMNIRSADAPLVLTFDRTGTAASLFSSDLDDDTLNFTAVSGNRMRD